MSSRNDVTGDAIMTKSNSQQYRDGWDLIFGKKNKTVIPPITNPMGAYWRQPDLKDIELDDKNAYMSREAFNKLYEYSTSIPTGVYPGKMWKAEIMFENSCQDYWELRWFGECEDPKMCSNNSRIIVIR